MKKWLLYGVVLVAAVLLINDENGPGSDIAKLEPARILLVEDVPGGVAVRTDMGQLGLGEDLSSAVKDMEETASGQVFLDTAEYLLVSPGAVKWLPELAGILRSSCQLCLAEGVTDPETAAEYLAVHEPSYTLGDWKKGKDGLAVLYLIEERMYLAKP